MIQKYFSKTFHDDDLESYDEIAGCSMRVKLSSSEIECVSFVERDTDRLHIVARTSKKTAVVLSSIDSQICLYDHAGQMVHVGVIEVGDDHGYRGWSFRPELTSGLYEYRDPGIFPVLHLTYKLLQGDRIAI